MGCEALAPATAGFLLGEPEWDALGGVAVGCAPTGPEAAQESGLEGIARLLDGGRIDPNTASQALLENLPGVGPGRSAAILEARERSPFETTRALERVPGIGPRTREKLEPFLAVDSKAPPG
jgi:DNA uptake protein ComE-like DNA-binding protein